MPGRSVLSALSSFDSSDSTILHSVVRRSRSQTSSSRFLSAEKNSNVFRAECNSHMNRENVAASVMVPCPLNESVIYVDQECIAGWVVTWGWRGHGDDTARR
jgi:hypothetical protein